jgi:hypothetical protein
MPPPIHMKILCGRGWPRLELQRRSGLLGCLQTNRAAHPWPAPAGASPMQDILWIGLFLTLLAASLGYVALCQRA